MIETLDESRPSMQESNCFVVPAAKQKGHARHGEILPAVAPFWEMGAFCGVHGRPHRVALFTNAFAIANRVSGVLSFDALRRDGMSSGIIRAAAA